MSTDIKLDEFAGNAKLSEGTLRGLVTRSGVAEELADLARPLGYTDGPALGVWVQVNHVTGAIEGSRLHFLGSDNPVVFQHETGARKIWKGAKDRKMRISFEIRVSNELRMI